MQVADLDASQIKFRNINESKKDNEEHVTEQYYDSKPEDRYFG